MTAQSPVRIELLGPQPERSTHWCATCCQLYMGDLSADPEITEAVRARAEKAQQDNEPVIYVELPHPYGPHLRIVRKAVTVAGSVIYPVVSPDGMPTGIPPMPVCWVHMQGLKSAP